MRVKCSDYGCGWIGAREQLLTAPSPFDPDSILYACPECLSIDNHVACCDEPECNDGATCGTPTDSAYRWTCYKHIPKQKTIAGDL